MLPKSRCGEDKFIFDLFEKLKTFLKNPLWVFNILNMVYTIYVPWTLRPVLSCHLVLSDPRFTLNKTSKTVGEFSLICCTSMAHAGNTKIWAKIISAYAKKCSITGFLSLRGGGGGGGQKRKYICPLGA